MRPPVELHRPTILNIAAIACYCLAMLFHIIAYATDSWSSLYLEGVHWRMGLWHGCRQNGTTWHCSTDVFNDKAFQTGSDWHLGSRVMMTLALIMLFLLEFAIIAYACIKNLERFKSRLVGIIIGLSISAGSDIAAGLGIYKSEINSMVNAPVDIGWSFGLAALSSAIIYASIILICVEYLRKSQQDQIEERLRNANENLLSVHENGSLSFPAMSVRTSVTSLSAVETYKKFASWATPSASVASLATADIGITNVSYLSDRSSIESSV